MQCDCGFNEATIVTDDNDLLCVDCTRMLKDHGWCMAHAARVHQAYGDDWTPAQTSMVQEAIRQPLRKHGKNRRIWGE